MRTILIRMHPVNSHSTRQPANTQALRGCGLQSWPSALVLSVGLLGCASLPLPAELVLQKPVVLLGEVHDNAAQHALRLRAFELCWPKARAQPWRWNSLTATAKPTSTWPCPARRGPTPTP
jgi:hypothetical protein